MLLIVAFLPYSGEIFRIDMDARSLAMGTSIISLESGARSILWNPAGVGEGRGEIYVSTGLLYEGTVATFAGYRFPSRPYAVGGYMVLSGGIELTTVPDTTRPPSEDNPPYVYAVANYVASALYFSTSFRARYGISLKLLYQGILNDRAVGIGADAGLRWKNFGIVIKDFLPTILFWNSGKREIISPTVIASGHFRRGNLLISLGVDMNFDDRYYDRLLSIGAYSIGLRGGLEYSYRMASFRAGYRDGKISMGFGIRYRNYTVDMGTFYNADLGLNYRVSLLTRF